MFAEDLTAFFSTAEHAIAAQLNGVDVVGIFNDSPVSALDVDGESLTFTLPAADADSDPRQQALVIAAGVYPTIPAGHTYTVHNFRHEGAGVITLILSS